MPSYKRNTELESLLKEVNELLGPVNSRLVSSDDEKYSKVLILGPLRSGTTVFTQWLASTGLVAYPTNLLSRFYGAPLVGARIQQLLTDPAYNFRNEILDFNQPLNLSSDNGKTKGALSPNEFWYFWRRFIPFGELDYLPDAEILREGNVLGLRDELNGLANLFGKPFMLKAMIMNQNIPVLEHLFEKALFVWIRRDPVYNIQSALEARQRQYGNLRTWYSFRIRECPELEGLDPLTSVAGQIHAINRSIDAGLAAVPAGRKLIVNYEDFCREPELYYERLTGLLAAQGGLDGTPLKYKGVASLDCSNRWRLKEYTQQEAAAAYERFQSSDSDGLD